MIRTTIATLINYRWTKGIQAELTWCINSETNSNSCSPSWVNRESFIRTSAHNTHIPKTSTITIITSSFARFTRSATSPSFACVSNPAPDSSLYRAAAPPDCVRFSCCSRRDCRSIAAALDCVCFNHSDLAASWLRPVRLLLPDCVHFGCCSPPAYSSHVHYSRTFYAEFEVQ